MIVKQCKQSSRLCSAVGHNWVGTEVVADQTGHIRCLCRSWRGSVQEDQSGTVGYDPARCSPCARRQHCRWSTCSAVSCSSRCRAASPLVSRVSDAGATQASHYFHAGTVAGARVSLLQEPLPWYLRARRARQDHKTQRSANTGNSDNS